MYSDIHPGLACIVVYIVKSVTWGSVPEAHVNGTGTQKQKKKKNSWHVREVRAVHVTCT